MKVKFKRLIKTSKWKRLITKTPDNISEDIKSFDIQSSDIQSSTMLYPSMENEYSLEKNMFSNYPQQIIPYSESGSWIGGYDNYT